MPADEFNFVNGRYKDIIKKKKTAHSTLTSDEQIVLTIWNASGIIENGGLQYFFEQELDAEATAYAYEKIGCAECAELLRLALSLFPSAISQSGRGERIKYIEYNTIMFENLSFEFWRADESMLGKLADYIRRNGIGKTVGDFQK